MEWRERITADPRILVGKPVVRGTRLSVEFLLGIMGDGWPTEDILDSYPGLTIEDLRACLKFASELAGKERVVLLPT